MGVINLIGKVFGYLTVIAEAPRSPTGRVTWLCRCVCGTEKEYLAGNLIPGQNSSCGCSLNNDLSKQKFGRLQPICRRPNIGIRTIWLCKCDCGVEKEIPAASLTSGRTKSCGCLRKEVSSKQSRTHGLAGTPEYSSWNHMMVRCSDTSADNYKRYGGRGIAVIKRWHKFENFLKDMGPRPEGMSLERRKNDKGYSKANCCWATASEQMRNRRNSIFATHLGVTKPLMQWAEELGIQYATLHYRWRMHKKLIL